MTKAINSELERQLLGRQPADRVTTYYPVFELSTVEVRGSKFLCVTVRDERRPSFETYWYKQEFAHEILDLIGRTLLGQALTAEQRAWALQQDTKDEISNGLREVREQGGIELQEVLQTLEQQSARP
jgi:hypothetical protein